ncbi:MAG: hypothetical protein EKK31_30160 [Hyphomicrobiales bacterium]|nr:MAG: hypothetical protein EKK31_30160 [Hyphomicrobiales bacterium]
MITLAELDSHYDFAVTEMLWGFDELQKLVPPPQRQKYVDGFTYRYQERTVHQALILKLARLISTLRGAKLLLDAGHVMEVGGLQRWLDETSEDIALLCGPLTVGKEERIHSDYLDQFWREEFDIPGDAINSRQKRGMVPRDKIQAYVARTFSGGNPSAMQAVSRSVYKAYSGFVHGAAVHILDIFGGRPPSFHLAGVSGTRRHDISVADFLNYVYRSLMSAAMIASAFKTYEVNVRLTESYRELAKRAGV